MTANGNAWSYLEDTVFQINDQIQRFRRGDGYNLEWQFGKENEKRIAYLVPAMFDKENRSFNWVVVADPLLKVAASDGNLNDEDTKYVAKAQETIFGGLYEKLRKGKRDDEKEAAWERFKNRYGSETDFAARIDLIRRNVDACAHCNPSSGIHPSVGSVEEVWTAILMLYSCYSHPKDHNFEGIFFRILEDAGHSRPSEVEGPVFGIIEDSFLNLSDWKRQRRAEYPEDDRLNGNGVETIKSPDGAGRYYSVGRNNEAEILRDAILDPLILDWPFPGEETSPEGMKTTFKHAIKDHEFLLLFPLYDVWTDDELNGPQGWGGLLAVLLIFLKRDDKQHNHNDEHGDRPKNFCGNRAWQHHYEKMLGRCGKFAQEITQAAIRRALARPIKPPYDLVRYFLLILVEVQDWEEAVVYYEGTPNYLFKRLTYEWREKGKEENYKGVREPWKEYEVLKNGEYYEYQFPELPDDKSATRQVGVTRRLTGPDAQSTGLTDTNAGEFYMWWTAKNDEGCHDLWSKAVLPGLSDDERAVVSGTSIRFKFPKACRVPPKDDKTGREFIVESYLRQQLELMRRLIPKVRARRAALRNAVSAIMGRNMSHNIGSHVLARYAAEIGKAAPNSESHKIDPAADFLSYLQRRMDFLAEVGTSDTAFWAQPLLLRTQLERLNLEHERERLRGRFTPLLTYITGKNDLPADVEFENTSRSTLFSCPGGEVGVHALYVILENVIRNSARHNPERRDRVHIKVCTEIQKEFPGLIKLRITDTGSVIKVVEGGKTTLPQNINDIMAKEILDPDGRPHPENWGIREMQICAQYLRQLQLSDLEDVPYAEQDMTAKAPLITAEGEPGNCLSYVIYLRQAKPLAKIEIGDETKLGNMKDGVAQVTLSRALLAPEVTFSPEDVLREERDVLREIRNYIFVAYNGEDANGQPNDLGRWAERHAGDLPLRRLTHIPFTDGKSPKLLLESLYEALARQIQKAQDSDVAGGNAIPLVVPAGLALAAGEAIPKPKPDDEPENNSPLTVKDVTSDRPWGSWIDEKCWNGDVTHQDCNKHRLDACIWLDHPSVTEVLDYSKKDGPLIRSIAVEPVFSHSPAAEAIRALNPGEGWELIAAALPRIVVLDERVQAARDNEVRSALKAIHCWPGMHVEVPTIERAKLDGPTFDACHAYLAGLNKTVDYVILHLTVLEKLNDERRRKDANETHLKTVDALIIGTPTEFATIMIVTGRGVSSFARSGNDLALAKRVRYLPVSALLEYLARRPSKLGLMRVLWSASSPRRESDAKPNPDIS